MISLEVPIISIVIGKGWSIGLSVSDKIWMLKCRILNISGFASILWKDAAKAEAANIVITSEDLKISLIDKNIMNL